MTDQASAKPVRGAFGAEPCSVRPEKKIGISWLHVDADRQRTGGWKLRLPSHQRDGADRPFSTGRIGSFCEPGHDHQSAVGFVAVFQGDPDADQRLDGNALLILMHRLARVLREA